MTHAQTMFKVIIPQVMRNILPSVSNEFVINIKDTSVLNVIGVTELYYFAGIIKRQNFQTFQTYLVVCILYFILTFTITRLLNEISSQAGTNYGLMVAAVVMVVIPVLVVYIFLQNYIIKGMTAGAVKG